MTKWEESIYHFKRYREKDLAWCTLWWKDSALERCPHLFPIQSNSIKCSAKLFFFFFPQNVPSWWKQRAENVVLVMMVVLQTTPKLGGCKSLFYPLICGLDGVWWGWLISPFLGGSSRAQNSRWAPGLGRCKLLSAAPGGAPEHFPLHNLSTWSPHHRGSWTIYMLAQGSKACVPRDPGWSFILSPSNLGSHKSIISTILCGGAHHRMPLRFKGRECTLTCWWEWCQ